MATKMKKTYGDPTKLTDSNFSQRAKRGVLREDPPADYTPPKKATKVKV
jgi:hypothetical protein